MEQYKSTIGETDKTQCVYADIEAIRRLSQGLLELVGLSKAAASATADSIVLAEIAGKETHGLVTLPYYLRYLERGQLNPVAKLECVRDSGAYLLFDAGNGVGRYLLREVVDRTIDRAKQSTGTCFAHVRNIGHVGVLGEFCEQALRRDCMALIFAGSANTTEDVLVAPPGTNVRFLGTNPIACGLPVAFGAPFIYDGSTSEVSFFAVKRAKDLGSMLLKNAILDKNGKSSADPSDFFDGGALAPLGGVKGFGLGLTCALLSGLAENGESMDSFSGVAVFILDFESTGIGHEGKVRVSKVLEKLGEIQASNTEAGRRHPGSKRYDRTKAPIKRIAVSFELQRTLYQIAIRLGYGEECVKAFEG